MPKAVADKAIKEARGNVFILESLLFLPSGSLGKSPYRIDIAKPKNLRIPSGNEEGANEGWVPGGYLGSGLPEAVIDKIEPAQYKGKYRLAFSKK